MLKKQTVWLLTLLSLMIVLSVFYMQSPDQDDLSFIFKENEDNEVELTSNDLSGLDDEFSLNSELDDFESSKEDSQDEVDYSSISSSEDLFTFTRMQVAELRSSQIEQLESVVASSSTSAEEKNEAIESIQEIGQLSSRELIVEENLKTDYGYPDVLVRTDDDNVIVTVKADQLSDTEANQIMRTVFDEFGTMQVQVKFQPSKP